MTAVNARALLLALMAYPAIGFGLGLADPLLGRVATRLGTKPGAATAVSVNLLMPIAAVALGVAHARLWVAWVGAVAMSVGLVAGLATQYRAGALDWSLPGVPSVVVIATFGYAILGTVAVLMAKARR
jgi:hypothetical protein